MTDEPAQYVRYAKSIVIHIELRPDNAGHIYAPYIEIDYDFASRHNISKSAASVSCPFIVVAFVRLILSSRKSSLRYDQFHLKILQLL